MTAVEVEPAGRPRVHGDRHRAGPVLVAALAGAAGTAMAAAGALVSARGRLDPGVGAGLGLVVGVLAVAGLPSASVRLVPRVVAAASAGLMVRLAVVGVDVSRDLAAIVVWIVAVVAIAVLTGAIPDEDHPDLGSPSAGSGPRLATRTSPRPPVGAILGRIGAISVLMVVLVALILPSLLTRLGPTSGRGAEPRDADRAGDASPLTATDRLDMTERPRLSDRVVMTVQSPQSTFWRQETFDVWDGRYWTRSDASVAPLGFDGEVEPASDDLGARGSDVISQRFEVRAPFATALPSAPSPSRVDVTAFAVQRDDGTLLAAEPLGAGATYTVESRRIPLDEEVLRAADGPVPPDVTGRYAEPPVTTARVRGAATDAVAGAATTYDRVLALQEWMGARTEYSLEAPLAPPGVDVVDDFLFESRQGWCEQIASSLVVMARVNGIPARLVSGFVPGDRSPLTGELQVRERDAHSWAEVWFPDLGWVPFDPTADVPLAGDDDVTSWTDWLAGHALAIAGGLVALVIVGVAAVAFARRLRDRRPVGPPSWEGSIAHRLDGLGQRTGRPREPWETASAHARALADRLQLSELADVGRVVDVGIYAPVPPPEAARAEAERVLDQADARAAERPDEGALVPAAPDRTGGSPGGGPD